jgi:hypothetical protein
MSAREDFEDEETREGREQIKWGREGAGQRTE